MANKKEIIMKDIIYFDQEAINSILAQQNAGYIDNQSTSLTQAETNTTNHTDSATSSLGFNALMQASVKINASDNAAEAVSETSSDLLNKMIGDYSLDLVLNDDSIDWKTEISDSEAGDFLTISSDISLVDFELISKITNPDTVDKFINSSNDEYKEYTQLLKKKSKSSLTKEERTRFQLLKEKTALPDIWNQWSTYGTMGSLAFPGTTIISFPGALAFADKNKFRLNSAQIFMLNQADRKARIIGQVTQIQKKVRFKGDFPTISLSDYGLVPSYITEILLGSPLLLEAGDRLIKPLAVYFE